MNNSSEEIKRKFRPDWSGICDNCEQTPIVPESGLCGPCHFGTARALQGDWWDDSKDDFNEENT